MEALFAELVVQLYQLGFSRFIVAGGETSGVVTQALGIRGFHIGPSISPAFHGCAPTTGPFHWH